MINYIGRDLFLENSNYSDSSKNPILLTKINGEISDEIILSDLLFLNSDLDTLDIKFSSSKIQDNSISAI